MHPIFILEVEINMFQVEGINWYSDILKNIDRLHSFMVSEKLTGSSLTHSETHWEVVGPFEDRVGAWGAHAAPHKLPSWAPMIFS